MDSGESKGARTGSFSAAAERTGRGATSRSSWGAIRDVLELAARKCRSALAFAEKKVQDRRGAHGAFLLAVPPALPFYPQDGACIN